MASKKATNETVGKKPGAGGKRTTAGKTKTDGGGKKASQTRLPSKVGLIEADPTVVVIAMSWQEASAGYTIDPAVAHLARGPIGECPPCGFMPFDKGIELSVVLGAAGGPQTIRPTCVKIYQFANQGDAQAWVDVDGPKFDLIMGLGNPA